ncbi:ABC transporter ATP-binding protein [Pusillimonas sp. CC-YST705]|uniref:ABC transporter ATP-binding protein n=1 Tax=Mesopusillimonas faecipullorum TaxID=2755040 RepID=A0ABS8C953_9BURK|nr:ABC transporter ATP-binding protein [Mesopusillimonas faecipullorum]MCB5362562.1 ABC transporter ATP-binding protein [Mesopusillimonas faecipullorum]
MTEFLNLQHVTSGYGETVILDDVSLQIAKGECVALIGRNGMGKTTLLSTLMGHVPCRAGTITLGSQDVTHWAPWRRSRARLGLVPQEREIFPSLTVEENLTVARRADGFTLEQVYEWFPRLAQRRGNKGNQLSGGEQQMLAIARAMMGGPELLLLDEPLEGLAPVIVDIVMQALARIREAQGLTMILVEQQVMAALAFAPRAVVLVRGRIVYDGPSEALREDRATLDRLIGVHS